MKYLIPSPPHRFVRKAVMPSLRARILAGTIKPNTGVEMLLWGKAEAIRGPLIFGGGK